MNRTINNNIEYMATVAEWTRKFTELMLQHNNAAAAILAYYLPNGYDFLTCPLGVVEFQKIGEAMRTNEAIFTAAEDSGLIAEAVPELFCKALDNYDSWCAMDDGISYMMTHPQLLRYVPFEYRYCAEKLLEANALLIDNEDLWNGYSDKLCSNLNERALTGY